MVHEVDLYGELIVEATRLGNRLFRNNIGMAKYQAESGSVYTVPYGVGGKGGADLIGFTIRRYDSTDAPGLKNILDDWIDVPVFTAVEVKPPGWKPRSKKEKDRHEDQQKFLAFVRAAGGIGGVVHSVAEYHELIGVNP